MACLSLLLLANPARADRPDYFVREPVYDPTTQSYYALVYADTYHTWESAVKAAPNMVYKGKLGKIAKVESPETLQLLARNFSLPLDAFIGLRLDCRTRTLSWADGTPFKTGSLLWDPNWHRPGAEGQTCGRSAIPYEGVFLTPRYLLQASHPGKMFNRYFVQFQ